jgi:hypothetical protein
MFPPNAPEPGPARGRRPVAGYSRVGSFRGKITSRKTALPRKPNPGGVFAVRHLLLLTATLLAAPSPARTAAKTFRIREVSADKGYPSRANFDAVDKAGGVLFAAFKNNTTGEVGGLYEKM